MIKIYPQKEVVACEECPSLVCFDGDDYCNRMGDDVWSSVESYWQYSSSVSGIHPLCPLETKEQPK